MKPREMFAWFVVVVLIAFGGQLATRVGIAVETVRMFNLSHDFIRANFGTEWSGKYSKFIGERTTHDR